MTEYCGARSIADHEVEDLPAGSIVLARIDDDITVTLKHSFAHRPPGWGTATSVASDDILDVLEGNGTDLLEALTVHRPDGTIYKIDGADAVDELFRSSVAGVPRGSIILWGEAGGGDGTGQSQSVAILIDPDSGSWRGTGCSYGPTHDAAAMYAAGFGPAAPVGKRSAVVLPYVLPMPTSGRRR